MRLLLRLLKLLGAGAAILALFALGVWIWFAWQLPPLQAMLETPLPACQANSLNVSSPTDIQAWHVDALEVVEGAQPLRFYAANLLFQDTSRTVRRQFERLVLSHLLKIRLSRRELAKVIFDRAYFGNGTTGMSCAAATRYDKRVSDLSLAQFAMLVGLIKAPTVYNPDHHPDRAQQRRNDVLDIWLSNGIATKAQVDAAKREPLG